MKWQMRDGAVLGIDTWGYLSDGEMYRTGTLTVDLIKGEWWIVRRSIKLAGPFDTLEAAKAAYLLML